MARPHWQPGRDVSFQVRLIVSEIFDVPEGELTPETHFVNDLDESLEIAATIAACEEEFGLEIPNADAEKLETVGLLTDYIQQRLPPRPEIWPPAPQQRPRTAPDAHQ